MNKKEIQKIYNKKIKLFHKYNKNYYESSSPLVADSEFDELKKNILLFEKKIQFYQFKKITFKFSRL